MSGKKLRDLLTTQPHLVIPGAYNAFVAKQIAEMGFPGVYLSGAGLSNSLGMADDGTLTLDDFLYAGRWIVKAVEVPVICDADTGFEDIEKTIEEYIHAGFAGMHIEDQVFPKRCGHLSGKEVVSSETMAEKVRMACAAREKFDPKFVVIARTDARGAENIDGDDQLAEAIVRGNLYRQAGADIIFPESLQSREEFARFRKEVPGYLLANMTEFGKTPFIKAGEFEALGYSISLFPASLFRYHADRTRSFLAALRQDGSQEKLVDEMMNRSDINALLNYEP